MLAARARAKCATYLRRAKQEVLETRGGIAGGWAPRRLTALDPFVLGLKSRDTVTGRLATASARDRARQRDTLGTRENATARGLAVGWLIVLGIAVVCFAVVKALRRPAPSTQPGSKVTVTVTSSTQRGAGRSSPSPTGSRPGHGRGKLPLTWFGRGKSVEVAGFQLHDPLVYASYDPSQNYAWATDPSEILLHAEVARPRGAVADTPYWPWYSRLDAEQRYEYLEWLASGKQSLPRHDGYLFLYFYGLERRMLVDEADHELVIREVVRLRKLDAPRAGTKEGRSFRSYSSGLLWYEVARVPERFDERAFSTVCRLTEQWTSDTIAAATAWLARKNNPLPAHLALHMARLNPRSQQSVVTKRVGDQFETLFSKRYLDANDGGLRMRISRQARSYRYRPASGGLNEVRSPLADPTGIPSQFEPLADIWNSCVDDLRRLSKVAVPTATVTVESWNALPDELKEGIDHPLTPAIQAVVREHSRSNAECLTPVGRLAATLKVDKRAKLTITQSKNLAATIEHTGYAVEPDARLTNRAYGWDDSVAVFLRVDSTPPDLGRYNGAACITELGVAVAKADGHVAEQELERLTDHIEAIFELPEHERRRLEALRAVLTNSNQDIAVAARRIEHAVPAETRGSVGRLLTAIAAADGAIDQAERVALRKCYRALGLPAADLEATFAEIESAPDDMVTVQSGTAIREAGEPIPKAAAVPAFRLNREAISAIMAETREVSRVLAQAMATDEPDTSEATFAPSGQTESVAVLDEPPSAGPPTSAGPATRGLGRYSAFFDAIRSRPRWSRSEAEALARTHSVGLEAAIETINDWSVEALGHPMLVDDGDHLVVEGAAQ
jgi:tellurite resistance protein